ncbi:MAG TPA: hypothetical protein VKB93_15010, partial [Thermoanaerobaculia bacterium]|nr:hypothetical protein [Thermoanaerobaculia bacterium]
MKRADLRRAALLLIFGGMLFGIALTVAGGLLRGIAITPTLLVREAFAWLSIVGAIPPIMFVAGLLDRRRAGRTQRLAVHVVAFLAVLGVHTVVLNAFAFFVTGGRVLWIQQAVNLARYDALLYPLVVLVVSMTRQRRITRRSELASARIARRVAQAQLDEMRVRLDPDEVAGELAEIEQAMTRSAAAAEERLHGLSRSLRRKLDHLTAPARARPRRARARPPETSNVRRAVLVIASAFGLYMVTLMVMMRLIYRSKTWRDLVALMIVFILTGLCAAAAIPVYRRAFSWRARTLSRRWSGIAVLIAFCIGQGLFGELIMMVLRRYDVGRPVGWLFDSVVILSTVILYVVAYDDLK